jgi:hypothetical protein
MKEITETVRKMRKTMTKTTPRRIKPCRASPPAHGTTLAAAAAVLLLFSLIIAACTSNPSNQNRAVLPKYYTGTDGVTVAFSANNPPDTVYEDSDVAVYAEIWNRGAYSIEKTAGLEDRPIVVYLGLDPWYLSVQDNYKEAKIKKLEDKYELLLAGKSDAWQLGEKTIAPLAVLHVNPIVGTRESPTTRLDLFACYYYRTSFMENVCIDGDVYNIDPKPICKNKGTYTYSGQGAPVIVSRLDVDMVPAGLDEAAGKTTGSVPVLDEAGNIVNITQGEQDVSRIAIRPSFRIHFTNAGRGIIFASTEDSNPCLGDPREGESMRIKAKLGTIDLECSKPEMQLYGNEGTVRCALPDGTGDVPFTMSRNYMMPLTVEAEYFYMTTASRELKVERTS